MSRKQNFVVPLTPTDERRVRVAAALEGCSFGRMVVLLVREGLDRRGAKGGFPMGVVEKETTA